MGSRQELATPHPGSWSEGDATHQRAVRKHSPGGRWHQWAKRHGPHRGRRGPAHSQIPELAQESSHRAGRRLCFVGVWTVLCKVRFAWHPPRLVTGQGKGRTVCSMAPQVLASLTCPPSLGRNVLSQGVCEARGWKWAPRSHGAPAVGERRASPERAVGSRELDCVTRAPHEAATGRSCVYAPGGRVSTCFAGRSSSCQQAEMACLSPGGPYCDKAASLSIGETREPSPDVVVSCFNTEGLRRDMCQAVPLAWPLGSL